MNPSQKLELTELIEEEGGKNWWVPEAFTTHILPRLDPCLKVTALPPEYTKNYNCFVFAFGLHGDAEFLGGNNPIQQEFVKYLLDEGVLHVIEVPQVGDLVFYQDSHDNITHGGLLKSTDTVVSKWMWGPTIENNLHDVPSSFGDEIFYCKPVPAGVIKAAYERYKSSGVVIKPIA